MLRERLCLCSSSPLSPTPLPPHLQSPESRTAHEGTESGGVGGRAVETGGRLVYHLFLPSPAAEPHLFLSKEAWQYLLNN